MHAKTGLVFDSRRARPGQQFVLTEAEAVAFDSALALFVWANRPHARALFQSQPMQRISGEWVAQRFSLKRGGTPRRKSRGLASQFLDQQPHPVFGGGALADR